jgi:hypothetical protein
MTTNNRQERPRKHKPISRLSQRKTMPPPPAHLPPRLNH